MEIVFFGSAQFGLPSLHALQKEGHSIVCVVTQPDKKKGRGLAVSETPIKSWAVKEHIPVLQPEKINTQESIDKLTSLNADLFVVIAYGQILCQEILDIPGLHCLNIHASLLPRYRGAAPIHRAIVNGETITGISVIAMIREMDAGPILVQKQIPILDTDTCISLEKRLSEEGAACLIDCLYKIRSNTVTETPQQSALVTVAQKLKKEDGIIHWEKSAREVFNLVRGLFDWPGAFTFYEGKILKIVSAQPDPAETKRFPGEIIDVSKETIRIACGNGSLLVRELQLEGKRKMTPGEFIAGHAVKPGILLKSKK